MRENSWYDDHVTCRYHIGTRVLLSLFFPSFPFLEIEIINATCTRIYSERCSLTYRYLRSFDLTCISDATDTSPTYNMHAYVHYTFIETLESHNWK